MLQKRCDKPSRFKMYLSSHSIITFNLLALKNVKTSRHEFHQKVWGFCLKTVYLLKVKIGTIDDFKSRFSAIHCITFFPKYLKLMHLIGKA